MVLVLLALTHARIVQEANVARKRKAASPVKNGPEAKRPTPPETAAETAKCPQVTSALVQCLDTGKVDQAD